MLVFFFTAPSFPFTFRAILIFSFLTACVQIVWEAIKHKRKVNKLNSANSTICSGDGGEHINFVSYRELRLYEPALGREHVTSPRWRFGALWK
ncbi:hypothetical protein GGR58DRAFT_462317 [Xylaria digitata]|nr:hypothetical protein GGR58DRAFT_462317 [Xylaria digitata]